MFEVSAELEFSAAHFHPDYDGVCCKMHGHNYKVVVRVRAEDLDELGMVCDFYLLKKEAGAVAAELDHAVINEHSDFHDQQPSAENIAQHFFKRLQPKLDANNHWLYAVDVWENDSMAARYIRTT